MNLWFALDETVRGASDDLAALLAPARAILRERGGRIAEAMNRRTEAMLDRELAGLEFLSARDSIAAADETSIFELEDARVAALMRPCAAAARREVDAAVAVRDALLGLLEEATASMERSHPGSALARAYRQAALRRGFPVEMRQRWSERAVAGALQLDGLEADVLEALHVLQAEIALELEAIRATAIVRRIERDPMLARDFIDSDLAQKKLDQGDDVWRELEHDAFAELDDRTAARLGELLTDEQIGQIRQRWT